MSTHQHLITAYNLIDTSSNSLTLELPNNPKQFCQIGIVDRKSSFDKNNCKIKVKNSNHKILNEVSELNLSDKNTSFILLFDNNNWLII